MKQLELTLYQEREITNKNATQRDKILELLRDSFYHSPSELMRLGIAQYNARIYELRKLGHVIESVIIDKQTYFILK
jgi:hypothetical protein